MHFEILWGKAPGNFFCRFVGFGARAALAVDDLCHKRFGDDCLGGLLGDGVADIWIGLKTGYHQNCFSMRTNIIPWRMPSEIISITTCMIVQDTSRVQDAKDKMPFRNSQ